jgi:hypothetical protein
VDRQTASWHDLALRVPALGVMVDDVVALGMAASLIDIDRQHGQTARRKGVQEGGRKQTCGLQPSGRWPSAHLALHGVEEHLFRGVHPHWGVTWLVAAAGWLSHGDAAGLPLRAQSAAAAVCWGVGHVGHVVEAVVLVGPAGRAGRWWCGGGG